MEGHFYILGGSVDLNRSARYDRYKDKIETIKVNLEKNGTLCASRIKDIFNLVKIPRDLDAHLIVYILESIKTKDMIDFICIGEEIGINKAGIVCSDNKNEINDHVFIDCNVLGCTFVSLQKQENAIQKGLLVGDWLVSSHSLAGSFVCLSFQEDEISKCSTKITDNSMNEGASLITEWLRHRHQNWNDIVISSDFDVSFIDFKDVTEC